MLIFPYFDGMIAQLLAMSSALLTLCHLIHKFHVSVFTQCSNITEPARSFKESLKSKVHIKKVTAQHDRWPPRSMQKNRDKLIYWQWERSQSPTFSRLTCVWETWITHCLWRKKRHKCHLIEHKTVLHSINVQQTVKHHQYIGLWNALKYPTGQSTLSAEQTRNWCMNFSTVMQRIKIYPSIPSRTLKCAKCLWDPPQSSTAVVPSEHSVWIMNQERTKVA